MRPPTRWQPPRRWGWHYLLTAYRQGNRRGPGPKIGLSFTRTRDFRARQQRSGARKGGEEPWRLALPEAFFSVVFVSLFLARFWELGICVSPVVYIGPKWFPCCILCKSIGSVLMGLFGFGPSPWIAGACHLSRQSANFTDDFNSHSSHGSRRRRRRFGPNRRLDPVAQLSGGNSFQLHPVVQAGAVLIPRRIRILFLEGLCLQSNQSAR